MTVQIQTTRSISLDHGIKVLVYGAPGLGKTYMARTAPGVLVISAESGLLSLRDVDLPVVEINNIVELGEVYNWCAFTEDGAKFQTLYLDSISEIAEVVLANEKTKSSDPRQAYGELIDQMLTLCKNFRDLSGRNVVFVSKEGSIIDVVTGMTKAGPSCPGARLSNELPYLFDEVFRYELVTDSQNQTHRVLRCHPSLTAHAKDRSGALNELERPDLSLIFKKIHPES